MSTDVSGIITQAAGYVQRVTADVVNKAKAAYIVLITAVTSSDDSMKGVAVERTGVPTAEDNAAQSLGFINNVMSAIGDDAEGYADITEFYSQYVTPGTNVAATSLRAAMTIGALDDVYNAMSVA